MKNVFLILVSLAFMSVAQAGPFGLKNGMTAEEIFKAGFKTDVNKKEEITGEKTMKINEKEVLENIVSKKIKLSKEHDFYLVNDKYPNTMFSLTVNENFGLTKFLVWVHCDDSKLLDALYEKYKESLERKYNNKFTDADYLIHKQPNEYNLKKIKIEKVIDEIPLRLRFDSRIRYHIVNLWYTFTNDDLASKMKQEARKREIEEKIKDLLPKDEDL